MKSLKKILLVFVLFIIYIFLLATGSVSQNAINVSVIQETTVIPLGNIAGIKLYTNGVLVVGMTPIDKVKPYEEIDIKEGDRITKVNDNIVNNTEELIRTNK